MITWKHTNIIVPASHVDAARKIGTALQPAGSGMYSTPLSPSGLEPATHFISSGLIDENMVPLLSNPAYLHGAAQQGAVVQGITMTTTLADATALIAQSDVSHEPPFDAMARLGLQMLYGADAT